MSLGAVLHLETSAQAGTAGLPAPEPQRWCLNQLAGRLSELCATAAAAPLTQALGLVLEAQAQGEPAAWVTCQRHAFYAPDAAASGIDLQALPVIRVSDGQAAGRVADKLLRSGAFGLVVVDLGTDAALPTPLLARLASLARHHHSALLFLVEQRPDSASALGSLISLRVESSRLRDQGFFACLLRAVKDRRQGPGWVAGETCLAPPGLT